ncbi:MAG: sigma-70 family RNA polymerase sigma factor [Burkholderiales bacterium]
MNPGPDRDAWARQDAVLRPMVARMARDDEAALGELYDATVSRVYGLALRITRTPAAAEDVVAEVYHQSWRDARRFDPERGAVVTWLLTICRSRAIDSLRRRDEAECHPDPETLAAIEPSDPSDPPGLLSTYQAHSALHRALAGLSAVQRQMIALAFFRGLSHQEIAEHCGMPLGTVKTHVRKALERLRLALVQDPNLSSEVAS